MKIYELNALDVKQRLLEEGRSKTFIKNHTWKYHFLITKIINKHIHVIPREDYIRISTKEMKAKLKTATIKKVQKHALYTIREDLKKWGIIRYFDGVSYESGQPKGFAMYKINDEILSMGWHEVKVDIPNISLEDAENTPKLKGVYSDLLNSLQNIEILYDDALEFLEYAKGTKMELKSKKINNRYEKRFMNEATYCSWKLQIEEIHNKRFYLQTSQGNSGRAFTNLCNLPQELRPFLRINGKHIIEIDICNSQPMLFVPFLELWQARQNTTFTDVSLYKEKCEKGELYSFLQEKLLEAGETINDDTFKADLFGKIFFATEKRNYKWRQVFANVFPNVSQAISYFKKDDYKKLALNLQWLEARIIIQGVASRLFADGIKEFFTLHDAIFITVDNTDKAKQLISEAYSKYNLSPTTKEKHVTNRKNYKRWSLKKLFARLDAIEENIKKRRCAA